MLLLTRRYNLSLTHLIPEDYVGAQASGLHGHDFKVEITLRGAADEKTGFLVEREKLDHLVRRTLIEKFDRTLVNDQLKHGTGEIIACEFLKRLRESELGDAFVSVQLVETRKNRFQGLLSIENKT